MKTHPNMSDDEWEAFLAAIPEEKKVPIEDYDAFLQKEGVTEVERQWWNGLSADEQDSFKRSMQGQNIAKAMHYNNIGMSPQEAFAMMHKTNAVYDDYPLSQHVVDELHKNDFGAEDYPLPWELCARVGLFLKSQQFGSEGYRRTKQTLEDGTSFNAAIRQLIRAGTI